MSCAKIKDKTQLFERCLNPDLLHAWLQLWLELKLPRLPVCPTHHSPFDYVSRAYFDRGDAVVWAPRGGGKTRLAAALTFAELLHKPGISVRILGGSLEQSLRVWEHLLGDVERLLGESDIDGKIRAKSFKLANRSTAAVLTQSQRAVRGLRVQKLRCDEVDEFQPDVWEAAQLVTRSKDDTTGKPIIAAVEALSTYHKPGGLMKEVIDRATSAGVPVIRWCLMEVLQRCPEERACETCELLEDCQRRAKVKCDGFFSIDDAIRMKKRVSRETWETEIMCRRPSTRGAVFGHFNAGKHVVTELPPPPACAIYRESKQALFLAVDFGYHNPFVCLWVRRDAWGRSFVIDEYVASQRVIDQHVAEIKSRRHGEVKRLYCDPAGNGPNDQTGRTNVERLKKDFTVRSKGSKIQDGIELIRQALCSGTGGSTLFIHPKCERLIAAMQEYRYVEEGGETPDKDGTHDHPIDALRYYYVNSTVGELVGGWY
jgi:hypothetical protein